MYILKRWKLTADPEVIEDTDSVISDIAFWAEDKNLDARNALERGVVIDTALATYSKLD